MLWTMLFAGAALDTSAYIRRVLSKGGYLNVFQYGTEAPVYPGLVIAAKSGRNIHTVREGIQ